MAKSEEIIAGMDEVGMGCLAGPLVVCIAAFSKDSLRIDGVDDSKKLTARKRESLMVAIREGALGYSLGWASPSLIDSRGIGEAWQSAAVEAVSGLAGKIEVGKKSTLIIDGLRTVSYRGFFEKVVAEPKADAAYWQVSAASIIAKVSRDFYMRALSRTHPEYLWDKNSGYGTAEHIEAIKKLGPVPLHHRQTFLTKI